MILVVNFGGQYAHLIGRRIRDMGVFSEIVPYDISPAEVLAKKPAGIVFSGGPNSVYAKNAPLSDPRLLRMGIPALGICYGLQLIAKQTHGLVKNKPMKEYGKKILRTGKKGRLLKGLKDKEQVWMSHGDSVEQLGKGFSVLGSTDGCRIAAFENESWKWYGVQFHPEVVHTPSGNRILGNLVFDICKAKRDYNVKSLVRSLTSEILQTIGNNAVIMGTSGGVDSTVAAVLIHKAIGDRLFCVFIDHGLIRKDEAEEVKSAFRRFGFRHFYMVDASRIFLKRLTGVKDPEKKRRIIGHTFIEVFEKKAKELEQKYKNIRFLGQGTIYPDRIESAQPSKQADKIKSHHNLTLPKKMKHKVIEPLKDLYKDGVRDLGKQLRIPAKILGRHPFPGPALAIRILGEITPERLRILQEADYIYIEELKKSGYYDKIWQAFAALFPVKSVGVMGDARTYEYIISLRAVTSKDAMTADWAQLPHEFLSHVASRIVNEVRGVNRVVYDITQKPPGTIEYE